MILNIAFMFFLFCFGIMIGFGIIIDDAIKKGYMKSKVGKDNKIKWVCDITQEDIKYDKENKK